MKFTKLALAALLLALLTCAFVACGGESGAENESGSDVVEVVPTPETDENGEHVHTVIEEIIEPTCEDKGYEKEICATCGEQLSIRPIPEGDHVAAAPATCTEASVCKFCGVQISAASGHLIGDVIDSKPATATEAGYEKGVCISCGQTVTQEFPAGLVEDFSSYNEGVLSAAAMAESNHFPGFTVEFGAKAGAESYKIVSEGGDKILSRAADGGATITLVDNEGKLGSGKFAISFDYRAESETASTGLVSFKDNNGAEHRLISVWAGGVIRVNKNTGAVLIEGVKPEDKTWYNIRVVVDPSTYDYEFYINGKKVVYTTADSEVSGGHLVWTLEGDAWVSNPAGNKYNDTSCFGNPASGISSIYLFHYGRVACSIDDLRIEFLAD